MKKFFAALPGLLGLGLLAPPFLVAAEAGPIQDNSFLIEEAYNQEPGVVQHIGTWSRARGGDLAYGFTQEWPAPGLAHQLSVTLPGLGTGGRQGLGDAALNYRYQLVGSGEERWAVAPRFSLLLPTGDRRDGRGSGHAGFQVNLPVSALLSDRFAAHTNLGATHTPRARDAAGDEADLTSWSLGQSLVWLAAPRFNVLLELVYTGGREIAGPGRTRASDSFLVSPGVRWSWDFASGLQIVPGIAFPIGAGPSSGERSVLLYLSFEHPF